MTALDLSIVPGALTICRLPAEVPPPNWALAGKRFMSLTRTADELSVVAPADAVPERVPREDGWRALRVDTELDFSTTGVLAALAAPLADAGIPIFAVSTHDRDFVLVKEADLERAVDTLAAAGHRFADVKAGTPSASDDQAR